MLRGGGCRQLKACCVQLLLLQCGNNTSSVCVCLSCEVFVVVVLFE